MTFGNWEVTEDGIEWTGATSQKFVINKDTLTEIIKQPADPHPKYKWIISATEEDWLSEDDLYDLNFAFVYAVANFGADFDYQVFDDTLTFQYLELDEEEEEEDDDVSPEDLAEIEQKRKEANSERD